ncbi:MAG: glycosyltransferase [Bacteroidia bacterium]|nr:glycosyltransferase [Bacteroidia bacterium]
MTDLLSIILCSYKSKERLIKVRDQVHNVMTQEGIPYELIIIDDGSNDTSFEIAKKIEQTHSNVFAYELSRNYTSHYAIFAGLSKANGSCATVIADDEQQPYHLLVECYRKWKQEGHKIIFPYRTERDDPWTSKLFANLFYTVMSSVSDFIYPKHGVDSFFIDREIIDLLNTRIHPINTTTVTELLRLGFQPHYLPYVRGKSTVTKSRWTFKKKIRLAKDWFFSTSSFPIKFITFLGVSISILSFGLIVFYLYIKLFGNPDYWKVGVQGWISIVILISFFSGLILLSLGIIAEYIWRIYEEVKNRPGYIIKQKDKSS